MSEAEKEPKAGGEPEQKAGQQRPRVRRRRPEQTRDDTSGSMGGGSGGTGGTGGTGGKAYLGR